MVMVRSSRCAGLALHGKFTTRIFDVVRRANPYRSALTTDEGRSLFRVTQRLLVDARKTLIPDTYAPYLTAMSIADPDARNPPTPHSSAPNPAAIFLVDHTDTSLLHWFSGARGDCFSIRYDSDDAIAIHAQGVGASPTARGLFHQSIMLRKSGAVEIGLGNSLEMRSQGLGGVACFLQPNFTDCADRDACIDIIVAALQTWADSAGHVIINFERSPDPCNDAALVALPEIRQALKVNARLELLLSTRLGSGRNYLSCNMFPTAETAGGVRFSVSLTHSFHSDTASVFEHPFIASLRAGALRFMSV